MSHLNVMVSLDQHPLGTMSGENFSVPSNYRIPAARIYVVNHSRTKKWKWVEAAMSNYRGAEDVLRYDDKQPAGKRLRDLYNIELLYKEVKAGRDMNRYGEGLKPVKWKLRLPGHRNKLVTMRNEHTGKEWQQAQFDGENFLYIPPSTSDDPDKQIWVEVPESTWDMYLGNYDRMLGFPGRRPREDERFDRRVQQEEQQALAHRWLGKHRPVFAYTDDGVQTNLDNPFGPLEFIRVTQKALQQPLDKEYLSALDLAEAM